MDRRILKIPPLLRHASGQARACFGSRDLYFGRFGTPEANERYDRTVAAWLANGRELPDPALSVEGLAILHDEHARTYYVKGGRPTSTATRCARAMDLFCLAGFGQLAAHTINTTHLKAFQRYLADDEHQRWSRRTINSYCDEVVRVFAWGITEGELGPPAERQAQLQELRNVPGLRKGRPVAGSLPPREVAKRGELTIEEIKKTQEQCCPTIAAMIEVQLLTGMRPLEITRMRACDISTIPGTQVRIYTPAPEANKLDHADKDRVIFIGPRAWALLEPRLSTRTDGYIFRPRDGRIEAKKRRSDTRKNPITPGEIRRRRGTMKYPDGEHYKTQSYGHAIAAAAVRAGVRRWGPNRLRHFAASYIAEHESVQVAQTLLGHSNLATTMIYVKVAQRQAIAAAERLG